jgi:transposase
MPENFINIDRDTPMFLPPDLRDWVPEGHMVHFVLEVVNSLELSSFTTNVRGTGSAQYPPSMMLALLVYCYATGRFSSREIEQASYYDVAVRYLCAQTHPDHDTICTFRRRNREAFEKFFVHVLEVAAESKVLKKVGTVSVDGTKVHANASKHSAVSYGRAQELLAQLENEVAVLVEKAEQADRADLPGTLDLPAEIARREERKVCIKEAMTVIEARHQEKLKDKQQAYEAKLAGRKERRERGERVRGREPKEPSPEVDPKDQYNFTDPESRIMKAGNGGHFEQSYNAQAAVEVESMLVVSNYVTDRPNDKRELLPNLERTQANAFTVENVLADTGYYSEGATLAAEAEGVEAYIAVGKQSHGRSLESILGEDQPLDLADTASAKERMAHKLKSPQGERLYRLRKQTVEPVFGIIKQCMRFRQFLMRGQDNVSNEWNLVCTAYNLKRIFKLINVEPTPAWPQPISTTA